MRDSTQITIGSTVRIIGTRHTGRVIAQAGHFWIVRMTTDGSRVTAHRSAVCPHNGPPLSISAMLRKQSKTA